MVPGANVCRGLVEEFSGPGAAAGSEPTAVLLGLPSPLGRAALVI